MAGTSFSEIFATKRIPLLLLVGYLVLKPFYVLPSGLPQPADALMVVLALYVALTGPFSLTSKSMLLFVPATLFVAWVAAVNLVWSAYLPELRMARVPAFYFYNLIAVAVVLHLHWRFGSTFFQYAVYGVALSVLMQVVGSVFVADPASGRRQILFFNNPNQLGYWSVLSASLFFVAATKVQVRSWLQIAFSVSVLYLTALSLSKAAMLSLVPTFVLAYSRDIRHVIAATALGLVVLGVATETKVYQNATQRIGSVGEQSDDSFSSRGYDRIWEFPEYLLFGAGEGAYDRFRRWDKHEFHSTFGTILFSYGFIGSAFFAWWMLQLYRVSGAQYFAYLASPVLYGVAHQGLRFSLLWLLLALLGVAGQSAVQKRKPASNPSRGYKSTEVSRGATLRRSRSWRARLR